MKQRLFPLLLLFAGLHLAAGQRTNGAALILQLPDGLNPKSAVVADRQTKTEKTGQIAGKQITFFGLSAQIPYDIDLTFSDGEILQGVNMQWYNRFDQEDTNPAANQPISADDREQIQSILQEITTFENKKTIRHIQGNHDRATVLVDLVRDKDFYAGKGQIIWRVELWYFKNEAGGWARVGQQQKVLYRKRYKTRKAYLTGRKKRSWIPQLGGITLPKEKQTLLITLPRGAVNAATKPASSTRAAE